MADKKKAGGDEVWGYEGAGKTKSEAFMDFLYDKKKGEVLGRTAKSWGLIGLFYLIYYCCLAAFWAALLFAFFATTSPEYPSWIAGNGIIGNNPGLGFRPHPETIHEDDSLMWFKTDEHSQMYWREAIEKFLHPYDKPEGQWGDYIMNCTEDTMEAPDQKACHFDIKELGTHCSKENFYGSNSTAPCIFLKLNKIYNWIPEVYDKVADIPTAVPEDLKKVIAESVSEDGILPSRVWLWCDGQNPADKDNIGHPVYSPFPGFHTKYYPFMNVEGYNSPLVAVSFAGIKKNTLVNVECKLWWPGVVHNNMDRLGMVRFQLMVDAE